MISDQPGIEKKYMDILDLFSDEAEPVLPEDDTDALSDNEIDEKLEADAD